MAKRILGISAFYHDSAAALVIDGKIIAAAQEERFTRMKQDHNFPQKAVDYCLEEANLGYADLDAVVFYDKPFLKFERLLETYLAYAPFGFFSFLKAIPLWLRQKLFTRREIDNALNNEYDGPIYFTQHHESHAASAFFPSPYEESAFICFDGVGEWMTTSWGIGKANKIKIKKQIEFPHSLGLLYSAFTYYTGFKVNSGEYKVMGLAPYGEPKYVDLIFDNIVDLKEDGSFHLDQSYFNYCSGLTMTSKKFHNLFGSPPRKSESRITQREMDLACSIQVVTEKIMMHIVRHVHAETGMKNLCLAGGCALNCVANGKILREGPFENIWIQPAAGDAGGALGAAMFCWYQIFGNERDIMTPDAQYGNYLGPQNTMTEITTYLDKVNASYKIYNTEESISETVAELLINEKIVGHVAGRMEFGPRALGNRSILGDPRSTKMQKIMNTKIKFRESFRPFAPSCLEEAASGFFEIEAHQTSPYMLLVAPIRKERKKAMTEEQEKLFGIDKLNIARSDLPSITHIDYSARVQTVNRESNPRYYNIINSFKEKTGKGVVINTSFNIRGEPIVCTAEDAYRCFMFTDMDALVLENCICLKEDQPVMPGSEEYKKQFKLD